ncbi:MAG TPA: oxidoreductase [Nakamurella sp.]|jgi:NAD(P)-dependent dehydrogenase (short-subunit alcohol dehydrogenase family)
MTEPVALVTGASSGIGEATARRLHELGYRVYAAARRLDRMSALADLGMVTVSADLTDDGSMVALVDRIVGDTGRIDVLVNNAGYGSYGSLEEVPPAEARRQVEVNVLALARLTQLVLPHMRERRSGTIVNVSSMGGKFGEPLGAWYHATKFAVEGLSDSIRIELAPLGIDVVVIEPGAIRTEWGGIAAASVLERSGDGPYAEQARRTAKVLAAGEHQGSSPDVVAHAIGKAVTAKRPRTRYAVGSGAKPMLLAAWLLPDRILDRMITGFYRIAARVTRELPAGEPKALTPAS